MGQRPRSWIGKTRLPIFLILNGPNSPLKRYSQQQPENIILNTDKSVLINFRCRIQHSAKKHPFLACRPLMIANMGPTRLYRLQVQHTHCSEDLWSGRALVIQVIYT